VSILLVTGTGTNVGKTMVTAALASLAEVAVAVVKPAQTGVGPDEPGDLAEVARLSGAFSLHEFARYPDQLSPEAAARRLGRPGLQLGDVAARIRKLDEDPVGLVLVEGAGGLLVSFARDGWSMLDLARELRAAVLVVVAAGLGTLNHTALTMRALAAESVDVAGLVIGSWPASPGLAERSNVGDLQRIAGGRLVGALSEGMASRADFASAARAALAPEFGGTFDVASFVAAAGQE
jgi:dethiobiotin synthetase